MSFKFIVLLFFFKISLVVGQNVKDSSFLVSAEIGLAEKSVILRWEINNASSFGIYKKEVGEVNWGSAIVNLPGSIFEYNDSKVESGKVYEYQIIKYINSRVINIGYLCVSINKPLDDFRNNILIVIDSVTHRKLSIIEIKTFMEDYIADGYVPKLLIIPINITVLDLKILISNWYKLDKTNNKMCLLIGEIAIPYSGLQKTPGADSNPDGHFEHGGAWPTDSYYADINGKWTDDKELYSGILPISNHNYINDNKFDQHVIPSDLEVQIGRVDMRNLPSQPFDEFVLIKNYLHKLHLYKTGVIKARNKAFISDNFGWMNGEMPMRSGWNNASAIVGKFNINQFGNYFDSIKSNSYLFSHVMGGGTYTSCSSVGTSSQFSDSLLSVFNVFFGSYFVDWNNNDNFLRSCLASKGFMLTACWSGRPHWYFHHFAVGYPIGYSTLLAQNNTTDLTHKSGYCGYYFDNFLDRRISISLFGDPALRIKYCAKPKELISSSINNNTEVLLEWKESIEPDLIGYHVYSSNKFDNKYTRLTDSIVSGLSFIDKNPYKGDNYYLIKAIKLEQTNTGNYFNSSLGISSHIGNINGSKKINIIPNKVEVKVYPNPVSNTLFLEWSVPDSNIYNVSVINSLGIEVYNKKVIRTFNLNNEHFIPVETLSNGIYTLIIVSNNFNFTSKFSILK